MNKVLKFSSIAAFAALVLAFFACSDSPTKKANCEDYPSSEECQNISSSGGGEPIGGDPSSSSVLVEESSSSSEAVAGLILGGDEPVGQIPNTSIDVNNEDCIAIKLNWNDQYNTPTVNIQCQNTQTAKNFTITGGAEPCSAEYYISCPLGAVENGKTSEWTACVKFEGTGTVSCKIGN